MRPYIQSHLPNNSDHIPSQVDQIFLLLFLPPLHGRIFDHHVQMIVVGHQFTCDLILVAETDRQSTADGLPDEVKRVLVALH